MTKPLAEALDRAWRRLPHDLDRPSLERAFRPALPAPAIDQLLRSRRIEQRLADRIADHLGMAQPTISDFQDPGAPILFSGGTGLAAAMRIAGAIRHRERIRPLVLRQARSDLVAAIGEDAFAAAQACTVPGPPPASEWTTTELIQACLRDAPLCVACWTKSLPPALRDWAIALMPSLDDIAVPDYPDRDSIAAGSLAAQAVLAGTGIG